MIEIGLKTDNYVVIFKISDLSNYFLHLAWVYRVTKSKTSLDTEDSSIIDILDWLIDWMYNCLEFNIQIKEQSIKITFVALILFRKKRN